MRLSPALLFCALSAAAGPPVSLEEKLLATVPAAHDERNKTRDPDGNLVETGGIIVAWSPAGDRVAWIGSTGGKKFGVIDGKQGELSTFADAIVFSPDGKRVAWRAGNRTPDNKAERWRVVLDGVDQPEFDLVGYPRFSPDGSRVAYWVNTGAVIAPQGHYEGGTWSAMDGEKKDAGTWTEADSFVPPVYAPDGKSIAFVASPKQSQFVAVAFGKTSETYGLADTPAFSADGKQVAWGAFKDGRWTVWLAGKPVGREYDHAGIPVFGPKPGSFAFVAVAKERKFVVAGGRKVGGDFDGIAPPVFSPDGKSIAFVGVRGGASFGPPGMGMSASNPYLMDREETGLQGGDWRVVVGGREGEAFQGIAHLAWSPDGKTVAFAGRKGVRWRVIAGTARSEEYDEVGPPQFSPDGKKVGFGARTGLELWWKVLDVR